jgi:ubiquinone/menaquinone biosynthesis C-methylase UbiE
MKYLFINKIYNLPLSNYLTGWIKKKLLKNNNITFIPTNKKSLPRNNHPIQNSIEYQEKIIKQYNETNKISFNSFLEIKFLLKKKFNKDSNFNFLDFGGDKLDLYLDISKEFKNINYYLINLPEVNKIIKLIKDKYSYDNLKVLNNLYEVKKNNYDFVYFGSTLQYLDNYENCLNELLPITKKNILFAASWFFQKDQLKYLVVKQLNFLPKQFYLYFFNIIYFTKILKKNNFEIEFKKQNKTHICSFMNFEDLKINNVSYIDILFKRC